MRVFVERFARRVTDDTLDLGPKTLGEKSRFFAYIEIICYNVGVSGLL
jgi:hypothetical protein